MPQATLIQLVRLEKLLGCWLSLHSLPLTPAAANRPSFGDADCLCRSHGSCRRLLPPHALQTATPHTPPTTGERRHSDLSAARGSFLTAEPPNNISKIKNAGIQKDFQSCHKDCNRLLGGRNQFPIFEFCRKAVPKREDRHATCDAHVQRRECQLRRAERGGGQASHSTAVL
jgi:hypothetical protein